MTDNVTNMQRERMLRRTTALLDPAVYDARMDARRAARQTRRDLAHLGSVTAIVVGGALFAACVIAIVWGVA